MGGHRENHAHVEWLTFAVELLNNGRQSLSGNWVLRAAVIHCRDVWLHHFPNFVGDGDAVAVQVHRKWGDDVGLGTVADGRSQWLACQHMCAVELSVDHTIQQNLPVRLCFQSDKQTFVVKKALFVGHGQWGHVSEFNEAKGQFVLFQLQLCKRRRRHHCGRRQDRSYAFHVFRPRVSALLGKIKKAADAFGPRDRGSKVERLCSESSQVISRELHDAVVVLLIILCCPPPSEASRIR